MKKVLTLAVLIAVAAFSAGYAYAAAAQKTYQVTGPVLELRSDAIVVKKGSENWEVARNASTKVTGDLKVGAKVKIDYTMTATDIEVKSDAATTKKKK
jgi:hypothetical protein